MITTPATSISVDSLMRSLDQHQPVLVLDIRPQDQRSDWQIPGSIHIDAYDALNAGDPDALVAFDPSPDGQVVTVCEAGKTSVIAADQLRQRGIDAASLEGGMRSWSLAWNLAEIPLPTSETDVVQIRRTGKGCLSYLIASQGEAAVIDPSLDAAVYQDIARRYGWAITHILDTHIHADHLMRSRQLAARTHAELHLPSTKRVSYPFSPLLDGDIIDVGLATIRVMHTPGHTQESSVYILDREAAFTGDTLFLEGVGRPDLEATPDQARLQAHQLYESLSRLLSLPPETLILPGHTNQPVAFDRNPLKGTLSDVRQRVALLGQPEEAFVDQLMSRIPPTPPNHHRIVEINEAGDPYEGDPADLEAGANRCAVS